MKTSDLIGPALDWAVAKCDGEKYRAMREYDGIDAGDYPAHRYSTDWSQGGPIIERESICIEYIVNEENEVWIAFLDDEKPIYTGATPLIAAMRCYVASKLGEDIDLPKELS